MNLRSASRERRLLIRAVVAAPRLAALGFDVDTVSSEGLTGRTDSDVWAAAQADGRLLVTQDLDFSDARVFAAGTHAGLFIVRLPDSAQWRLGDYLVGWSPPPTSSPGGGASSSQRRTSFGFNGRRSEDQAVTPIALFGARTTGHAVRPNSGSCPPR